MSNRKMAQRWFKGTCSNCRAKKVSVHQVGSAQVCGPCSHKLQQHANIVKVNA